MQAEISAQNKEVPVACVFVKFDHDNKEKYEIVAKAHNLTNITGDVRVGVYRGNLCNIMEKGISYKKYLVKSHYFGF